MGIRGYHVSQATDAQHAASSGQCRRQWVKPDPNTLPVQAALTLAL